jgi:hypothetical protein
MKTTILTSTLAVALFATAPLQLSAEEFAAQSSGALAQSENPPAPLARSSQSAGQSSASSIPTNSQGYSGSLPQSGSASVPPVVIQFEPNDATPVSAMEEDLATMTRLLEKSLDRLGETPTVSKLGLKLRFSGDSRSVRATYLEGFGALFMVKVNFPVFDPTNKAKATAQTQVTPKSESEWQRAKRELLEGIAAVSDGGGFDVDLDSSLKNSLIRTLTNAANIRGLSTDNFVAVTVFGSSVAFDVSDAATNETHLENRFVTRLGSPASQRGTVLTLRVKYVDAEALARGEITAEQFQSRVTTHAYFGNGHAYFGNGRGTTWGRETPK